MRLELSKRPIGDVVDALAAAVAVTWHLLVGIDGGAEMQIRQAVGRKYAIIRSRSDIAETDRDVGLPRREHLRRVPASSRNKSDLWQPGDIEEEPDLNPTARRPGSNG